MLIDLLNNLIKIKSDYAWVEDAFASSFHNLNNSTELKSFYSYNKLPFVCLLCLLPLKRYLKYAICVINYKAYIGSNF